MKKKAAILLLCLLAVLVPTLHISASATSADSPAPVILEQPADSRVAFGQQISTAVLAQGDALTYQWYYRYAGSPTFIKSDITAASYSCIMTPDRCGQQLYCTVTDGSGNCLPTQIVTLRGTGSFQKELYKIKPNATKSLAQELTFHTDDTLSWESSDETVAKVNSQGVVTGVGYGTATITARGGFSGILAKCTIKVCDVKQVALTFDDGPSEHTSRLLDFLEDKDIKVTFFMVGNRISYYGDTVQRIAEQGHEIGYHSYSHRTQTRLSNARIISDYETSCEILDSLVDTDFTLWRTPGGAYSDRVLNCIPLPHIMWSVDTRDWATRNSYRVYSSVLSYSKDGSIVLLHDLHGTTVTGAIMAMEEMLEGDYEFLTVSELLSRDGAAPAPSANYFSG